MAFLIPQDIAPRDKTFKTIFVEDKRFLYCNIKTLNLIPSVLAAEEAKEEDCDEAIFHRGNMVTEMAHSNVSFLIDGKLIYHPFDDKILPGIAVKHLINIAKKLGIQTESREVSMVEALNADELIVTSSGTLCNRIISVDKIPVGGKDNKTFTVLQEAAWSEFYDYTHQQNIF